MHEGNERFAYRQAEARATVLARRRGVRLNKRSEQQRLHGLGDADPAKIRLARTDTAARVSLSRI